MWIRTGIFVPTQVWVKDESAATKMEISAPKAKPAAPKPRVCRSRNRRRRRKLKKGQTLYPHSFRRSNYAQLVVCLEAIAKSAP